LAYFAYVLAYLVKTICATHYKKTNNHLDFSQEIKPSMVREKITMIATT